MLAAASRVIRALTLFAVAGAVAGATPRAASAQAPAPHASCAAQPMVGDACQKALDIFEFSAPQLGVLLVGGSATPGQYQALGGLGKFSLNVRATAARLDLPDDLDVEVGAPVRSTIATTEQWGAGPAADAELGIFGGIPLGLTTVGAIDLLGSAFYIPDVETDDVTLDVSGGGFRFGVGVRVGIIQEGLAWPGVSVTYLRRGLPKLSVLAQTDDGDSLQVRDLSMDTDALRLMVGKRLGFIGFLAGVGQDTYKTTASIGARVEEFGTVHVLDPVSVDQKVKRTNVFGGISLNFPVVRIVGEIGRVSGGSVSTYNEFDSGDGARARTYMSLGLRAGI